MNKNDEDRLLMLYYISQEGFPEGCQDGVIMAIMDWPESRMNAARLALAAKGLLAKDPPTEFPE